MTFELLVSAVKKDARELVEKMHIASDAVIMSQGEDGDSFLEFTMRRHESLISPKVEYELIDDKNTSDRVASAAARSRDIHSGVIDDIMTFNDLRIRYFKSASRGVGLSRNTVFENAGADIVLFGDEDIVYEPDYVSKILNEFADHPEADMILFNVKVCDERRTYWNEKFAPVKWYNCGRYPAYSIAVRRGALKLSGVKFSLLFGGGAKYSNGEDSLFLNDCLKTGMKIFSSSVIIGEEEPRPSTWFFGYNDKLFYDRGVLYHFLYGRYARLFGLRWLLKMKGEYSDKLSYKRAKQMLFMGIADRDQGERRFDDAGALI